MSRQCQLLMSRDGCVRFLADRNLKRELGVVRKKFRPATLATDIIATNPAGSRRALSRAAKQVVKEDEDSSMMGNLQSLEQQGQMSRC